ncbi:DNA-3-methyladenine glycosylase [Klenkia sp. PcliD-1-E]|uniref:DNA-3-methyladenine glycosylase family protein n=1 Tax=Klenkia sp. PcliD-1-E TaxID=2954492 RepID=UPI002097E51C|nr:hypothetical protein [Klenkia sp. PcliD-1-E]MCO7219238.1 hypothetical protein [Klenkia sp. PcliD-1-E]
MRTQVLPLGEVDPALVFAPLAMLGGDPSTRLLPGRLERASPTPEGPGTLVAEWEPGRPEVRVRTAGDGGAWLAARAPDLLGLHDDASGFAPGSGALRELWRRRRGDRVGATGTLWHDLASFVLQQRVTRKESAQQWARFVRTFGVPAADAEELVVPPAPEVVARLPYERLHALGVERRRSEHLVAAARRVSTLLRAEDLDRASTLSALGAVPGIGPWTTSCLSAMTFGDADTVITGDSGIPARIAWVLAREARTDDARMLQLLEPHRPHRYRVLRLAFAPEVRPPRRAPRPSARDLRRL